jgi:hypothetical protein
VKVSNSKVLVVENLERSRKWVSRSALTPHFRQGVDPVTFGKGLIK